jgi:hypothetical protein
MLDMKKRLYPQKKAQERGHRGHKMTGPEVLEGSRVAREDQITPSNTGSGKLNHTLEKGVGKWYVAMTRPCPNHTPKTEVRPKNNYVSEIEKQQTQKH